MERGGRRMAGGAGAPQVQAVTPFREILVSCQDEDEPRVAVLEHGRLAELDLERPGGQRLVGNVYKGRVQNVLPGMQAAFVDIGLEKNAFLYVDDARWAPAEGAAGRPNRGADIRQLVHPGQEVVVQVRKEPSGGKGARVSRALSLPGRYMVLLPGLDYVGVSRRIAAEAERERLRAIAQGLREPGWGLIVRTAAAGVEAQALRQDWAALRQRWEQLWARARQLPAPALIYRDLDPLERVLRDRLGPEVARVVVDDPRAWERLRDLAAALAPEYAARVVLANPEEMRQGLFAARGVEAEIERALGRRVGLACGGHLIIDQTEALTAIDVNTGRFVGASDPQATFLETNLEAAAEIARQIRLRDIGGIIIVDFIDMANTEHRRRVLDALSAALAADSGRANVLGLTHLGLVEITRRKSRQSLSDLLTRTCTGCEGRGRVLSEGAASRRVRRVIGAALRGSGQEAILVETHPAVAALVIGPSGSGLKELEARTGRTVCVRGAEGLRVEDVRIRALGSRAQVEAMACPVREGQILDLVVEDRHAGAPEDGIARLQGYIIDIQGAGACLGRRVRAEVVRTYRTHARARLVQP